MVERKDYVGIISDENNPKIISNELDQAPKTWKQYEKRLDWMKNEIAKAMDIRPTLDGNPTICKWIDENQDTLPLLKINKILGNHENDRVAIQVDSKKKEFNSWEMFESMLANLMPIEEQIRKIWNIYSIQWNDITWEWLEQRDRENNPAHHEWEIWTFISFDYDNSWCCKVSVHQIEKPNPTFLMNGLWCHKELTAEEFLVALEPKNEEVEWEKSVGNKPIETKKQTIFDKFRRKSM